MAITARNARRIIQLASILATLGLTAIQLIQELRRKDERTAQ